MGSAPHMEDDAAIELRDATVRYGRRLALEKANGTFATGSMTAVVGANGAGKTTLLAAIAGTVHLAAGTVERRGAQRTAYLPQVATIARDYPLTVGELITLGGWREFGIFRAPDTELKARASAAADQVGLAGQVGRPVGEISAGELQRAMFARVILQNASVILLDEPFAAVDAGTVSMLTDQLSQWHHQGRTVICVLHDLDLVRERFPATVVLARRVLAWGPTVVALRAMAVA